MSGIYIHIPFCRQACTYCNFHFSTNLSSREEMVDCILREGEIRAGFLGRERIKSIYLGGGTPSVLTEGDLNRLFDKLGRLFEVEEGAEITLEANPDDLDRAYLEMLSNSPVNRLSMGIQCLDERLLKWMNRSHDLQQAVSCVENALELGFENLTADLIYGLPGRNTKGLISDLDQFKAWGIPHFSAYALTVEPKTVLAHRISGGNMPPLDEELAAAQFEALMDWAEVNGYEHYEISNFAVKGMRAVHNSSYWSGIPYLGLGPSAHSYDGKNRYWNISNNALYMKGIRTGEVKSEREELTAQNRFNEYIMTGMRLMEGISLEKAIAIYPAAERELNQNLMRFIKSGHIQRKAGDRFSLTGRGKLLADYICSELMSPD